MPFGKLPETVGETTMLSWQTGAAKGFRICTDDQGDVTFTVRELHLSPDMRLTDPYDVKATPFARVNFRAPDDCTAVQVTLKAGTGSSSIHTQSS